MTPWITGVGALVIAAIAGAALLLWTWPAGERLNGAAATGLSLLLGPFAVGSGLMAGGAVGSPIGLTWWVVTLIAVSAAVSGGWRWRARGGRWRRPASLGASAVLCLALVWTSWLALQTHLGWDGTVVWYHKARMLTQSAGWMPPQTLRDTTRTWTAPDYPLHVPLAEAWLLAAIDHDERILKLLPAAWCAGIVCFVFGAVRGSARQHEESDGSGIAIAAALLLVTVPRLLVGEGSLTSGYADGPMAGLLAALLWIARRSDWGRQSEWQPMLAVVAAALAWTKQEGVVAVGLAALVFLVENRGRLAAVRFAWPALALAVGWQAWVRYAGAPATMAYAWPGAGSLITRSATVGRVYLQEMLAVSTWGLLWPALWFGVLRGVTRRSWQSPALIVATLVAGAAGLTLSHWPDVAEHARVTVPRQLIHGIPALAILLCTSQLRPSGHISLPRKRL